MFSTPHAFLSNGILPSKWTLENVSDLEEINYESPIIIVTPGILISNQAVWVFQWVCYASICPVLGLFGTVANIINIICFIKQGLKDPVNVSLLVLAVSDVGCLVTLTFMSIIAMPVFEQEDMPFVALDIDYLVFGWPHIAFTRITSWITTLITLERCLCVTMPLKVKTLVTRKRTVIIIFCVYIVLTACISPVYCVNRLAMIFYPDRNKTILGIVHTKDRESVEKVGLAINNVIVPFTAFLVTSISTIILVITLQKKTKWRNQSMSTGHAETISSRDRNVAKMIVFISTLFIVCFIPICVMSVGMILEPELAIYGKYKNHFLILSGLGYILESTNSSVNIFIYYQMSSKYRTVFREIFSTYSKGGQKMAS